MKIIHRYNNERRQHFLLEKHYSFQLKPRLLYAGQLEKQSGWKEEPHSHEFLEIIFVTGGKMKITVEDREYDVVKGDIVVYNAGLTHFEYSSVKNPAKILFVAFDNIKITDLLPNRLIPDAYEYVFHSGEMYDLFYTYFNNLIKELKEKHNFYVEISQNISRTLLMLVFRLINYTRNSSMLLDSGRTVNVAVSYIEKNFRDKITLEDLSAACFTNKFYLSHLFTRITGKSIGKYITETRIKEAQRLLLCGGDSIEKVAELSGFMDAGYFCRTFKKLTGQTPSAFRRTAARNQA